MASVDARLFQCWYTDHRQGPSLQLIQEDGKAKFVNKGILGNTRNVQTGECHISHDTISAVGPIASTCMLDPPGFTTVLGDLPVMYHFDGTLQPPTLTLTDAAGRSAVLRSWPHIPAMAARLGKTHIMDAIEGKMSDWYILRLLQGDFYPCFMRPDDADRATGSGTRLQIRAAKAYDVLSGKADVVGGLDQPQSGDHESLNGTGWMDFSAGEDTVAAGERVWKASFDQVEIPPGWGPREMEVPVLHHGQEKLVLISRSFVSVVAPKYRNVR